MVIDLDEIRKFVQDVSTQELSHQNLSIACNYLRDCADEIEQLSNALVDMGWQAYPDRSGGGG